MDEYIGIVKIFGGTFAPRGWMFCNGQTLPISGYEALFTLLGTTYGGDGMSTFALPNLNGRIPIGTSSSYIIGQSGGVESVTLTSQQIPAHNHSLNASDGNATTHKPTSGNSIAANVDVNGDNMSSFGNNTPNIMLNQTSISGGTQPHENRQPYIALNFIICTEGIYPSQA